MSISLVLEGGGMRGWYTSGVLTAFSENKIEFPRIYGISAGASNALSYISKQNSRKYILDFIRYTGDERYISINNLRRTGYLFGFDFIFGEMYHSLMPFDYQTFRSSPIQLLVGATDLKTGQPVFFDNSQLDENFTAVKASCSLPFISHIVCCQGYELLDGGCSMPIPIERALSDGNDQNVIILTRDISYRKRLKSEYPRAVLRVKYRDYPNFVASMMKRPEVYNHELDICQEQEASGNAVVIRPSIPLTISRYEKKYEKLVEIYELGYRDGQAKHREVAEFLKKSHNTNSVT